MILSIPILCGWTRDILPQILYLFYLLPLVIWYLQVYDEVPKHQMVWTILCQWQKDINGTQYRYDWIKMMLLSEWMMWLIGWLIDQVIVDCLTYYGLMTSYGIHTYVRSLLVQIMAWRGGGGGGGHFAPKQVGGRGEGSAGWILTPTGVSAGRILTPTGVSNFHNYDPKWVVKFENFTNITQREWLKMKIWYPTGVCLTFEDPTRVRVYLWWKMGV